MRLLLTTLCAWWCSAYTLGDRLLLQVNDRSFTQRQLEAHILVREALRVTPQPAAISAQRWRALLDTFREDMLILSELERYDRYLPRAADIETAEHYVLQKRTALQADFVRLGIDDDMLRKLIVTNLKINSYRRVQSKNTTTATSWLRKIERRNAVRFYRGSSLWMPIHPQWRDPATR